MAGPNPPATFIWRVRGGCMKGAGIHDEDLAVVDRSLSPTSGAVVVAAVDGEMSLKRLIMTGDRLALTFDNPEMQEEFALGIMRCDVTGSAIKMMQKQETEQSCAVQLCSAARDVSPAPPPVRPPAPGRRGRSRPG